MDLCIGFQNTFSFEVITIVLYKCAFDLFWNTRIPSSVFPFFQLLG